MAALRTLPGLLLVPALFAVAAADAFLKAQPALSKTLSQGDVEKMLLSELLGDTAELHKAEQELQDMYVALPKNMHGTLEPATVRYALHRYFVQKHGWSIQGVDSDGDSWNKSSSPAPIMKERAPAFILNLFERRLNGRGFGLRELAAFAATVSDLIRTEAVGKLELVYQSLGLSLDGPVGEAESAQVLKSYLIIHLMANNIMGNSTRQFEVLERALKQLYRDWPDTLMWFTDLQQAQDFVQEGVRNPFVKEPRSFARNSEFLQEFMHGFGPYQNQECKKLKGLLVDMEHSGSGRVPLSRFYKDALQFSNGTTNGWHFRESAAYLRNLGALDETDTNRPSVVITNYLHSEGNCLRPSSFYSVCCMSECESLMSHLEREVGAPSASAVQLAALVSKLPSDTVDAPRNISDTLLSRLNSVAHHHGGSVPLHGRLFAQWMHHVYPRECPFPLVSGTTSPMTPDEWMVKKGHPDAKKQDMERYVRREMELHPALLQAAVPLPWDQAEELVSVDAKWRDGQFRGFVVRVLSVGVSFAALASFAAPTLRGVFAAVKPVAKVDKCMV